MKNKLLLFFSILLHICSNAQSGGNGTYSFLNLSSPARPAALGGTLISIKDNDLNLSFQNPSLLDSAMHNSLSLSYIDYLSDIKYGYAAYSRTYKKIGSFSAGMQFLDYGDFDAANTIGEITGKFYASDYSLNLAYARPLIDSMLSVGATVKTIYSKLGEYTSIGNALDIGAVYYNNKRLFSAGLIIKNIGKQWKTYTVHHEPLPFEIQLGVSKKINHAPFRINFTFIHLEKWDLTYINPNAIVTDPITGLVIEKSKFSKWADKLGRHVVFGGEVLISKNFHLRLGYNYLRRQEMKIGTKPGIAGFSFGFGLKVYKFNLSYAYAKMHLAGGPNHFTITTNLSEFYTRH